MLPHPRTHDRLMPLHRWPPGMPAEELGAIVHGPVILARATGIAAGLRCIFAHPGRLLLPLVVRANGVQAEAASRQSFRRGRHATAASGVGLSTSTGSDPQLHVSLNERSGFADVSQNERSGGDDGFDLEASYWIDEYPRDGRVHVVLAWPQAGLPETSTVLTLEGLDDAAQRILRLL